MKSILRWIFGTVKLCISGNGIEKLLSKLLADGYNLWNVQINDEKQLIFECYKRTYKKFKNNIDHFEHQVTYLPSLHLICYKYRHRWGLAAGTFIFAITFYLFTLFIWDIQVTGCKLTSAQEIITGLSEHGLTYGKLKNSLNIKTIENSYLQYNDKLSWISVNIKGTTAFVEIREKERKAQKLDTSKPSSIYAARDGVIASVKAYMGYPVVLAGDTVTAGDLIVSGDYTDKYGVQYKLHSYASVMAYTTHTFTVTVPYKTYEQQMTGKSKNYFKINLIRLSLPLYFNENIRYNNYNINKSKTKLRLGNSFALPFSIEKTTYTETEQICYTKSKEAALMDAYEKLSDCENDLVGIVVNDRSYEIAENTDGVTVTVELECYEDIGIEKEIN